MRGLEWLGARVVVGDGAMGTQLMAAGMAQGVSPELWGSEHPEAVLAVHRRYVEAGCDLITTNSFQGTATALGQHGLAGRACELNRTAAQLAVEACADKAWAMGSIGPSGEFLEPYGDMTPQELEAVFAEQVAALVEGGVQGFTVETMSDPNEAACAVRAAKSSGLPVMATFAFQRGPNGFVTMMGVGVEACLQAVRDAGADVVGGNCGTDLELEAYVELGRHVASFGGATVLQPNAGRPEMVEGRLTYRVSPEEMAEVAVRLRDAGLAVIGGCCGTSPAHLSCMSTALLR